MIEKMKLESQDVAAEKREELKQLFPSVFTETKNDKGELVESVDFEKLKAAIGEFSDVFESRRERYGKDWPGKKDCLQLIQRPATGTLKPAPEESIDFDTTENVFIEGDNLEVLKLLQKAYYGKVKAIYIDPPYNTGHEFIYPDAYSETLETYLAYAGLIDDQGRKFSTNSETEGRFHTKWLNMMFPRLYLARNLLQNDGVVFVSIDEHEFNNLRVLMDEIFGEENRLGAVVWKGATDNNPTQIAIEHEYVLCYVKSKNDAKSVWKSPSSDAKSTMLKEYERLTSELNDLDEIRKRFRKFVRDNSETLVPLTHYTQIDESGVFTGSRKVHNPKPGGYEYDVIHPLTKKPCIPPANGYRYPKEKMDELLAGEKIIFGDDDSQIIQIKESLKDFEDKFPSWIVLDSRAGANEIGRLFGERKVFTNPKPYELLQKIFGFVLEEDDILIDFFAGSATSAQAILEMNATDGKNRRFILVQLPERISAEKSQHKKAYKFCKENRIKPTIAELAKERIRRTVSKLKSKVSDQSTLFEGKGGTKTSSDQGFRVFKLVESNFRSWDGGLADEKELLKQLELSIQHVSVDADEWDLLTELLLNAGFPLDVKIAQKELGGSKAIFSVSEDALLIFLGDKITQELLDEVVKLEPIQFICLDKAFQGNDQLKANAVQTFSAHNHGRDKSDQIIFRTV